MSEIGDLWYSNLKKNNFKYSQSFPIELSSSVFVDVLISPSQLGKLILGHI